MTRGRRGFTFVELIVVTVLGSLVLMAALQVLITNRRAYTAQAATISGQQTTRMAIEILFAELREVSPSGGDILRMDADSITVRLMRKFSYVCATDFSGQPELTVVREGGSLPLMSGSNGFVVGDSVFVYADNDEDIDTDDVWIPARVSAIDATTGMTGVFCPQGLGTQPGYQLTFNGQGALFAADSVGIGAPVRSYDQFTFGTTTMNGDVYLARRDPGAADYMPMAGPLQDTNGLQFVYRDSLGAVTNVAADVAQVEVTVRTGSEVLNSLGGFVQDSVRVWIYTRN